MVFRRVIGACYMYAHLMVFLTHTHTHTQHDFLRATTSRHHQILVQLIQRTQEAVRLQDNQSFTRNRKMLMDNLDDDEDSQKEETEIESEPPR